MRNVAILLAVTVLSSAAAAEDETVGAIGAGTATCAKYAEGVKKWPDEATNLFTSWAQGFMSGVNVGFYVKNPEEKLPNIDAWSVKAQQQWINDYCDKHPLKLYAQAVADMLDAMRMEQGLPGWRAN